MWPLAPSPTLLVILPQRLDFFQAFLGGEVAVEESGEGLQEGVFGEKELVGQAVSLAGEREVQVKVSGSLEKEVQLQDFGLPHLAFHLKKEAPEAGQVVFPFQIFPALVFQEAHMLSFGQLAEGNDLAHVRPPSGGNVSNRLVDSNKKR